MKLSKENLSGLLKKKNKEIIVNGYEITITEMTIPQQLEIETILKNKKSDTDLITPMLKFSVVDENGEFLLDDNTIAQLPANTAASIFKHCIELNSINDKDLEERAKNF